MADFIIRAGTKRAIIKDLHDTGLTWRATYDVLAPKVREQVKPWIFSANVDGSRIPKSIGDQLIDLKNEIRRTYALISRLTDGEIVEQLKDDMPTEDEEIENLAEIAEEKVTEPEKHPDGKTRVRDELEFFYSEWKRVKRYCEERSEIERIDSISMRPIIAAKVAIPAGIPARAMLSAMALHWNRETRMQAGIEDYDFRSLSEGLASEYDTPEIHERLEARLGKDAASLHPLAPYAIKLATAGVPLMLVGPAGSGKSHIAEQTAAILDLAYGECPLTAGATPSWLLGSHTINGYGTRPFIEIYSSGGVFNFEEIDAADPNMLLVTNNALASKRLFNPVNGERIDRDRNFVPVSTANTYGLGANREYTARERMDAATIDRWRMGRIYCEVDESLAYRILTSH